MLSRWPKQIILSPTLSPRGPEPQFPSALPRSSGAKVSDEQVPGGALAVAIAEAGIVLLSFIQC